MIQPKELREYLEDKYSHKKINDDLGFTGEYSLGVKDLIDIGIDFKYKLEQ